MTATTTDTPETGPYAARLEAALHRTAEVRNQWAAAYQREKSLRAEMEAAEAEVARLENLADGEEDGT